MEMAISLVDMLSCVGAVQWRSLQPRSVAGLGRASSGFAHIIRQDKLSCGISKPGLMFSSSKIIEWVHTEI